METVEIHRISINLSHQYHWFAWLLSHLMRHTPFIYVSKMIEAGGLCHCVMRVSGLVAGGAPCLGRRPSSLITWLVKLPSLLLWCVMCLTRGLWGPVALSAACVLWDDAWTYFCINTNNHHTFCLSWFMMKEARENLITLPCALQPGQFYIWYYL